MTTIDLAPEHKVGLTLTNPVMPAAGCYGLGAEYAQLVEVETLGAVVVGPVTAAARQGTDPPRTVSVVGGVLVHTGLANPGIGAIVHRAARAWARSPVPVIVHVAGTSPDEVVTCCKHLSGIEAVAGIEVSLPDTADVGEVADVAQASRAAASQPLIVRLPLSRAAALCEAAVASGAAALTIAAPPRGTAWHAPSGRFVTGRLYGPLVLPLALLALRCVRERVAVPLIGCGGIHNVADALAHLRAGAVAVQVGGALWRDPSCLARIARQLSAGAHPC